MHVIAIASAVQQFHSAFTALERTVAERTVEAESAKIYQYWPFAASHTAPGQESAEMAEIKAFERKAPQVGHKASSSLRL